MSRHVPFSVLAAALLVVPSPAHADEPDYMALTCGLVSTTEPTGLVEQSDVRNGTLNGGPVVAGDFVDDDSAGGSHTGPVTITLRCWVQFNDATADLTHWEAARNDQLNVRAVEATSPGANVAAGRVRYRPPNGAVIFTCSWVHMEHAETTYDVFHDDNTSVPGSQCAAAQTVSAGHGGTAVVVPKLIDTPFRP